MKRVAFRVFAGILCAAGSIPAFTAAAEPLPALELVNATTRLAPGASTLMLVVRRDDAAGKAVSLRAPDGAKLWQSGAGGACTGAAEGKASLDLDPGAANPAFVCFSMDSVAQGVRVIATVSSGDTVYNAVTQPFEIAAPPSESLWDKPGVSMVLSALVGFLFGLGSAWLQVWFDTWKEARLARADAQKFIAESLFPELREHAIALANYLAADAAELRRICTTTLKVPQITVALSGDRLLTLTSYFDSVSKRTLKTQLGEYDKNLDSFNRWADRLKHDSIDTRDPGEQKLIVAKLYESLKGWKIA